MSSYRTSTAQNNYAIQQATLSWLTGMFDGMPSVALTLTFVPRIGRKRVTMDVAQQTLRHFLRRINRVSRGKKFRERQPALKVLAVLEGGDGKSDKHLHYHLQLEVPFGRSATEFGEHCLRTWSCLDWGSVRQNRMSESADEGWTGYMLKLRDKPIFADAIDMMNFNCGKPERLPRALSGTQRVASGCLDSFALSKN